MKNAATSTIRVLIASCGLATVGTVHAQTQSWTNAAGGSASTSTNWSPVGVPSATSDLIWNLASNYSVSFSGAVPTSRTHSYRRGTLTLTMSSPHTATNGVAIADLAGDVATVTLTTGTWTSGPSGFVNIADAGGTTGTFNINDDDAEFIVAGNSDLFVGNNGTGTMNITAGGRATLADTMHVGQASAATGNLTVSGQVAQVPFPVSTLTVNGLGESRWGNGGDATVNISDGARAQFAGDLIIGNLSASTATVTVQGVGIAVGATVGVAGDLLIGRNTSAGVAAGVATLNVNAPGRVLVDGTMSVAGDPDGGTATLHTASTSLVQAGSLTIGTGSTLDLDGGAIDVMGGTLAWTSTASSPRFNGGVDNPVITMRNGANATLSPTAGGIALVVGGGAGANFCDFDVRSGSDLTTTGSVTLGEGSDDRGEMIINGVGTTMTMPQASTLTVGSAGDGRFEAELGGVVTGGRLNIAGGATSFADVLLENPGTTATFRELHVGGADGLSGGNGLLVVNNEAVLNISNDSGPFVTVYSGGKIDVSQGAVINAPGIIIDNRDGVIVMEGGPGGLVSTLNATRTVMQSGSILRGPNDLAGAAAVNGQVRIMSGATLVLVNGDLTVGIANSTIGFEALNGSTITVGSHTLTIHDADRAVIHDLTIDGGHVIAPNGIEIPVAGVTTNWDGTGTITTSELFVDSGGSVITATGANGLTIAGKLRNNSGMLDGTKYTFSNNPAISDSGWTGAGNIDAKVVFNSGTQVNSLANMTMGDGSTTGVTFNAGSELHASTRTLTLLDSNGVALPSVSDLTGGRVVCAQQLVLNAGRRLSGRGGSYDTPNLLVFGGIISPGEVVGEPAGETGELTINGNMDMDGASRMDIELQGVLGPVLYDRLVVNGAIDIDGTLNISQINGFVLPSGHSLPIILANSITGNFDAINAPSGMRVFVTPTTVVIGQCPADFNQDGFVDFFDFDDWILCFETFHEGTCATGGNPDFNIDGFVDFFDYDEFVLAFENGC